MEEPLALSGTTTPNSSISNKEHTEDVIVTERAQDGSRLTFENVCLSLPEPVLQGLSAAGFKYPSPVQLKTLPLARFGADVIVQAKSGTGKTIVFAITAVEQIANPNLIATPLILTPTREIATQIQSVVENIGKFIPSRLKSIVCIGGIPLNHDIAMLSGDNSKHSMIVIGTPGRVRQLMERAILSYETTRMIVLDEADKLLSEEFWSVMNYILSTLPQRKQVLAFSATYSPQVRERLELYMRNPHYIQVTTSKHESQSDLQETSSKFGSNEQFARLSDHQSIVDRDANKILGQSEASVPNHRAAVLLGVTHKLIDIDTERLPQTQESITNGFQGAFETKCLWLEYVLQHSEFQQCIVFSNKRSKATALQQRLNQLGFVSECVAGDMPQPRRNLVIDQMRKLYLKVLISTDLTARGLDLPNVKHVFCLDLPHDSATLMHRMGRAGRFGTRGEVVSILNSADCLRLQTICDAVGVKLSNYIDCNPECDRHDNLTGVRSEYRVNQSPTDTTVAKSPIKLQILLSSSQVQVNQSNESALANQSNESAQANQSNKSALANQSNESAQANQSNKSALANQSNEATQPNQSSKSTHPNQSSKSTHPNQSSKSTHPNQSSKSTHPNQSSKSTHPNQSNQHEFHNPLRSECEFATFHNQNMDRVETPVLTNAIDPKKRRDRFAWWVERCAQLETVAYTERDVTSFKACFETSKSTWDKVKSKRMEYKRDTKDIMDNPQSAALYTAWLFSSSDTLEDAPSRPWITC